MLTYLVHLRNTCMCKDFETCRLDVIVSLVLLHLYVFNASAVVTVIYLSGFKVLSAFIAGFFATFFFVGCILCEVQWANRLKTMGLSGYWLLLQLLIITSYLLFFMLMLPDDFFKKEKSGI